MSERKEREIRTPDGHLLLKVVIRGEERYVTIKAHGKETIYRIPIKALIDDTLQKRIEVTPE